MAGLLRRFTKEASGTTALEYGLLASTIAVTIIAGMTEFSETLSEMLFQVTAKLNEVLSTVITGA